MKGDEKLSLIGQVNDMLRMPDVAMYLGFHPDSKGFIKSPFQDEKTASCKLYTVMRAWTVRGLFF